jgi:hypothetical protein
LIFITNKAHFLLTVPRILFFNRFDDAFIFSCLILGIILNVVLHF